MLIATLSGGAWKEPGERRETTMSTTNVMKQSEATIQELVVWINDWQYSRVVRLGPEWVALQVTRPSCSHCPTCQRRVQEFTQTLAGKPEAEHAWAYDDRACWLILPVRPGENGLERLKEVLDLRSAVKA